MRKVIGLIPSAGMGSRLFPYPCPKELLPVSRQYVQIDGVLQLRPKVVSQYLVENMRASGVKEAVMIINPHKSEIMKYYGDGHLFGMEIAYVCQQTPNGLPIALDCAYNWIKDCLVVFGLPDTIIEPSNMVVDLLQVHEEEPNVDLVVGMFNHPDPSKLGMIQLGSGNYIKSFIDKPKQTNLTFAWGLVSWKPRFTEFLHAFVASMRTNNDYAATFSDVMTAAIVEGYTIKGVKGISFVDIGTFDEYTEFLARPVQETVLTSHILIKS